MMRVVRSSTVFWLSHVMSFAEWVRDHAIICCLLALATFLGTGLEIYWHLTDRVPAAIQGVSVSVEKTYTQTNVITSMLKDVEKEIEASRPTGAAPVTFTKEQEETAIDVVLRATLGMSVFAAEAPQGQYCPLLDEVIRNSLLYGVNYAPDCLRMRNLVMIRPGVPGPIVTNEQGMAREQYPGCQVGDVNNQSLDDFGKAHGKVDSCPGMSSWMGVEGAHSTDVNVGLFKANVVPNVEQAMLKKDECIGKGLAWYEDDNVCLMDDDMYRKVIDALGKSLPKTVKVKSDPHISLVFFDQDSDTIKGVGTEVIRDAAEQWKKIDGGQIVVVGFTDRLHSSDESDELSDRTMNAVVAELVADGVEKKSIIGVAQGQQYNLVPNEQGFADAVNRRVEILVQ